MKRALLCAALLTLTGCALTDRLFMPREETVTNEDGTTTTVIKPPFVDVISGPISGVPYGGLIAAGLGLVTGLYQSVRRRQETEKKLGIMSGIEIAKENWENINDVKDLIKALRQGADARTLRAIDADLEAARAKGVI